MKKKIFLFPSLILLCLSSSAQITVTSVIIPDTGDTLITGTATNFDMISLGATGGPQEWDFTNLETLANNEVIYQDALEGNYTVSDASLVVINGDLETYYKQSSNKLELIGTFGPDALGLGINALATYDPAELVYNTPMSYEDENTSVAKQIFPAFGSDVIPGGIIDSLGLPITPDSLRFSLEITKTSTIDAYGTLSIPLGNFEVLRERRTDSRAVLLGVKVSIFPWADIELPTGTFEIPTTIAYYYWSNNAKEPIAIVNVTEIGGEEQITTVEFKTGELIIDATENITVNSSQMSVQPNPANSQARFMFNDIPNGNYDLVFFDILGRKKMLKNMWLNHNQSVLIDISSLQNGTYFYGLMNDKGKILMTKELIIQE